ncbi:SH3 domain-containing protein [Aestuariimicrobium sp. Y1814]|uniref:SH3 domain-containing protein n=1 Tax=Aestuariimicrobium sp. Y1814 TaxID=3418742 RepID=UPI003DA715C5
MKFTRKMQAGAAAMGVTASLAVASIALSPDAIANYGAVTATTAVNIRTSPSTSASILGVLYAGNKLTQVGAITAGWVPVKYGSRTAYISANYLTGAKASENSAATTKSGDTSAAWTTEPLNVRTGPTIKYRIITTLAKGTKVERTGLVSGDFTQILHDGSRAWVSSTYLGQAQSSGGGSITTTSSVKATAALAVRNQSGRSIAGYTAIPNGTVLPATGQLAGHLTEVVWRGARVWVTSAYVSAVGSTPNPEPEKLPAEIGTRYATTALNVRTGAGTNYALVTTVAQGTALKITGTVKNGFAEINYNGATRWVSAAYLSSTPSSGNSGGGSGSGGGNTGGTIDLKGSIGLNGLKPSARNIVNVVASRWGLTTFYGVRPDALPDHPSGHAVDIMLPQWSTSAGKARGWEIANYLRANAASLDIQYVIFDQKIWNVARDKEGWRTMANRGSATANHKDHVHVTTKGL